MKSIVAVVLIVLCAASASAQKHKPDPSQYVKQDTNTAFTPQQVAALAGRLKEKAYAQVRGTDKLDLDKALKKLDEPDEKKRLQNAYELSSAAMLMMGASQDANIFIPLAAAPVELIPSDPLLVSNFAALLRVMDSTSLSLPVLVYAKNLAPKSPIILTNLGNTVFEFGDDRSAEVFFKRALKIDPHFRDARSSLVLVYLKRGDMGSAYEELMKGVEEVTYTENTKRELARTERDDARKEQTESDTKTPPPPAGPPPSGEGGGSSGGAGKTPEKLILPPFPDWTNLEAFMGAQGPGKWQKELSKGFSACLEQMQKPPHSMSNLARRNEYAMEVMQQYMDDRYARVIKDYKETEEKNGEAYDKSYKAYSDAYAMKSEALGKTMEAAGPEGLAGLPEYQKLMVEYGHQTKRLTEDHYEDWKKNARIWHTKTNDLLQEYWVYCEQYLNHVYGDNYDRLNNERRLYVYGKLSVFASAYSIMPLAFLIAYAQPGATSEATPFAAAAADDMSTTVPNRKGPPCPIDGKFKVPFGPGQIKFDCESAEIEGGEGLIGSVKHNFKNHTTTVGVFAGVEGEFGAVGASFKQGMTVTFDGNGQPTDAALVQEATGHMAGVGGRSITMTVAAVAGIDLAVERETTLNLTPAHYHHYVKP